MSFWKLTARRAEIISGSIQNSGLRVLLPLIIAPLLALPATTSAETTSFAQDTAAYIELGGVRFTPRLAVGTYYDSNLLHSDTYQLSSTSIEARPGLQFDALYRDSQYRINLESTSRRYAESSADNVDDFSIKFKGVEQLGRKHRVTVDASLERDHEARGLGFSEGAEAVQLSSPDQYQRNSAGITYRLGSKLSRGRIELGLSRSNFGYLTRESELSAYDRVERKQQASFYYRVMPKTFLVLATRQSDLDYDEDNLWWEGSFDSRERQHLLGLTWTATAKTTGRVLVGLSDREFRDSTFTGSDWLSWEAEVTWKPKSYSEFRFETSRTGRESWGRGSFIQRQDHLLSWDHSWNDRLSTSIDGGLYQHDYQHSQRDDQFLHFGVKADYSMRRWLDIAAGVRYSERDTMITEFQYHKSLVFVELKMSL